MATNPILARIVQSLGAGGVSGPQGQPTDDSGMGAQQMASELHGADPAYLLKSLQVIKQQLSQLFVMSSMQSPGVSGNIAKAMTTLDRAIKDAQQMAATASVVKQPLGFSPAGGNAGGGPSGGGGAGIGMF